MSTYIAPVETGQVYNPRLLRMSTLLKAANSGLSDEPGFNMPGNQYAVNYGAILKPFTNLATAYIGQQEDAAIEAQDTKQLADWAATAPTGSFKQGMGPLADQSNVVPPSRADRQAFLLKGMADIQDPDMKSALTAAYLKDVVNPKQRTPFVTNLTTGFQVDPDTGDVKPIPEVQTYNEGMKEQQYQDRAALKQMMIDAQQGRLNQTLAGQDQRLTREITSRENLQGSALQNTIAAHQANRDYDVAHPTGGESAALKTQILEQTLAKKKADLAKLPAVSAPVMKNVAEMADLYNTFDMLKGSFKKEFAGSPVKKLYTEAGTTLGGLAPKNIQAHTQWWALNNKLAVIPERLKAFGATLTPSEKKSWDQASVNEATAPDKLIENFNTRMKIFQDKISAVRRSEKTAGRNYKQIDAYFGDKAASLWPEIEDAAPTENTPLTNNPDYPVLYDAQGTAIQPGSPGYMSALQAYHKAIKDRSMAPAELPPPARKFTIIKE
jgi:hypothetical protein